MLLYVAAMPTEGIVGEGGKDKVEREGESEARGEQRRERAEIGGPMATIDAECLCGAGQ